MAEFQQTRQVIVIKSAHTQPRALYKLSSHESQWWIVQRDNCAIFLQAQYYWLQTFVRNTQSDYKEHEITWNKLYCKGISAIWEGN